MHDLQAKAYNTTDNPRIFFLQDGELKLPPRTWVNVPEGMVARLEKEEGVKIDYGYGLEDDSSPLLKPPHLLVGGPVDRVVGWGVLCERFLHHLSYSKYNLTYLPLGYAHDHAGVSPVVTNLVRRSDAKGVQPHEWALCFTMPYELPRVPAKNRILYTMWEAAEFPKEKDGSKSRWPDLVNQYTVAVIVPTFSQMDVWRQAGVRVPIHVVPLGVDTEVWKYQPRPPRPEGAPFTLLLYGILWSRKSPIETVVDVCWQAFKGVNDWRLILKTMHHQLGAGTVETTISDPHVEVIDATYTLEQMWQLTQQADAFFFGSKFEGAGLPPLEAMSTGLPVFLTNYSGLQDISGYYNHPIPIAERGLGEQAYEMMRGWGIPDWAHAAEMVRAEYEDWKARGRTQSYLGEKAANWVRRKRTWEQCTDKLLQVLEGYIR